LGPWLAPALPPSSSLVHPVGSALAALIQQPNQDPGVLSECPKERSVRTPQFARDGSDPPAETLVGTAVSRSLLARRMLGVQIPLGVACSARETFLRLSRLALRAASGRQRHDSHRGGTGLTLHARWNDATPPEHDRAGGRSDRLITSRRPPVRASLGTVNVLLIAVAASGALIKGSVLTSPTTARTQ